MTNAEYEQEFERRLLGQLAKHHLANVNLAQVHMLMQEIADPAIWLFSDWEAIRCFMFVLAARYGWILVNQKDITVYTPNGNPIFSPPS